MLIAVVGNLIEIRLIFFVISQRFSQFDNTGQSFHLTAVWV